jgi:hypothetical protein
LNLLESRHDRLLTFSESSEAHQNERDSRGDGEAQAERQPPPDGTEDGNSRSDRRG